MAELRREVINYLKNNRFTLGDNDIKLALDLETLCSYTISNHDIVYGELSDFNDFKQALKFSRQEIEHVDPLIQNIENEDLKKLYIQFGIILLLNVKEHIKFFNARIVIFFCTFLIGIFMNKQRDAILNFLHWFEKKKVDFSKYDEKYNFNI
ncbi:MAG: hypothetical protein WAU01_00270 [Saprospiraceae bacterium]